MATKNKTFMEWFPQAAQLFRIGFSLQQELIDAVTTLETPGTQVVRIDSLVTEFPETWAEIATVTIADIVVVDDIDETGTVLLVDGAVQFTLESEGPPPHTDPAPGDTYSIYVQASRADDPTLSVAGRTWLSIKP